jgi:hypothetical protein
LSRRPEPTALAIAEVVFGMAVFTALIGGIVLLRAFQRGAIVQGRVTRSARRIEVAYTVDGVSYDVHGSTNYANAPLPGQAVAVRYMQTNPSNGCVAHENFVGAISGFVVAVVFAVFGGGLLWFAFQVG